MIQLCPNCGKQWCVAKEQDAIKRVVDSYKGSVTGNWNKITPPDSFATALATAALRSAQSMFNATYNPVTWLKAGKEALIGDKYKFHCPTCNEEWSTSEGDQTAEYEKCKKEAQKLIERTTSMVYASSQEQINHIEALKAMLKVSFVNKDRDIYSGLYEALAYSQLVLQNDTLNARNTIEKSLSLFPNTPTLFAVLGMTYNVSDKPYENYKAMQYLIKYKEIKKHSVTHFTMSEFEERLDDLYNNYRENFLSIPTSKRHFLFIDDELRHLPNSFVVLPMNNLGGTLFPTGHPHSRELYAIHPYNLKMYMPYNDYQISLFRDETKELCWIMECLGAKSISFHEEHMEENKSKRKTNKEIGGSANYKALEANVAYRQGRSNTEYSKLAKELMEVKTFDLRPDTRPFLPQDLVWYEHRIEWRRIYESRMAGRLLNASLKLSISEISAASERENDAIEADLKILLFNAKETYNQTTKSSRHSKTNHTWIVDVVFYPLSAYNDIVKINVNDFPQTTQACQIPQIESTTLTHEENEYLIELKEILADGEISPRERRLLEKIRIQSGISEERAAELENSLTALQLTEEEQEYLDEYKDVIADGEITEKARRLLDKFRKLNGISEERAKEIEASVKR